MIFAQNAISAPEVVRHDVKRTRIMLKRIHVD